MPSASIDRTYKSFKEASFSGVYSLYDYEHAYGLHNQIRDTYSYDRPSAFRICLALERIASSISFIVAVLTGPDFVCIETRNERASNAGSIT